MADVPVGESYRGLSEMACDIATIDAAACVSEIGRVENPITLLQLTAQSALDWAEANNPGVDYSLTAVETRACASGIGWVQDETVLLRLIAQNLCNMSS